MPERDELVAHLRYPAWPFFLVATLAYRCAQDRLERTSYASNVAPGTAMRKGLARDGHVANWTSCSINGANECLCYTKGVGVAEKLKAQATRGTKTLG
jgi:hypothetical protein